jgi:hypothetical protein
MRTFWNLGRIHALAGSFWLILGATVSAGVTDGQYRQNSDRQQTVASSDSVNTNEYLNVSDTTTSVQKESLEKSETLARCFERIGDGHWVAAAEAVWLGPRIKNQSLLSEAGTTGADPVSMQTGGSSTVDHFYITPRVSLGYQWDCWGVQARYWKIDTTGFVPESSDSGAFFDAQTFDFEATRAFCWRDTQNQFSFGLRYADYNVISGVYVPNLLVFSTDRFSGIALGDNRISGVGPTLGLNGLKPIRSSNINVYYGLRGSLIGDNSAMNYTKASVIHNATRQDSIDMNNEYGYLFIGEAQLGVQWNFELVEHLAKGFFRLGFEYQYWGINDMTPAFSTTSLTSGGITARTTASADNAKCDLYGLSMGMGFTW